MRSGNSSPVGRTKTVETEAHQDVFEVRFDHLTVGGTAFIILIVLLGLYWLYRQRRRNRYRQRRCRECEWSRSRSQSRDRDHRDNHHRACCHSQLLWYPMPPFLPSLMNSQAANPWISMDILRPTSYNTSQFTELQETRAPATTWGPPPVRPPPPREPPSPHSRSTTEETA